MNDVSCRSPSLEHHGILGQKWGIRRYQYKDGRLTPAGRRRLERKDSRWAVRNYNKVTKQVKSQVQGELNAYSHELTSQPGAYRTNGKLSAATINAYNRRMAQLMNQVASDITSPSDRVVQFVAKRGEIGVHMALADRGYDMDQLRNGVWSSGRVAYRKQNVDML